jgi:hypothetical protein
MDMSGITTTRMDLDSSNLPETLERFHRHVELIFNGPLKGKEEEEKIAYLLILVDEKGRDIQQTWNLSADDEK